MIESHPASPARAAFALGATLTGAMALWLLFVAGVILPSRDPAHVPLWRGIAAAFLAWAALSAWCIARPPRGALRAVLTAAAVAACALGVFAAVRTLAGAPAHFEGYLVVMGALLAAHGVAGLAWVRASTPAR